MTTPTVDDFIRLHQGYMDAGRVAAGLPPLYGDGGAETIGGAFIASEGYSDLKTRAAKGTIPTQTAWASEAVQVGGGMRALITSADTSAGDLVQPFFRGLLEPGLVRPLRLRNLVSIVPVTTDAIEYVKETSRVAAAAPVAEASALTGSTGTKPEGGLVFDLVTDTVKTFALWVPTTRRVLSDATGLSAYINQYLADDLAIELEDQMISGDGTGDNFTGLLTDANLNTAGPPSGGQTMLDVIRTGKRLVQVNGKTNPTAILVNPEDEENIERLKDTTNRYIGAGPYSVPFNVLWGMPVVVSEAIAAGTAIVGDFKRAVLFDRESVTMSVGTVADDFVRNIVRVLGEVRAGFGIIRPKAFTEVDLVA